ncbi:PREDICTED: leucine-rich repeat protein 1 [Trachymyrmex cornetzi]|uniref:Peptidylprolyl isomerase-like 5 n=1 Tax=Trachymyrmex cornetzi TaxID=471704 RepID=A0A195EBV8_9HYME|nr:PREDICTED: leucine-rich repeat protein 1 [Trachymyrmex cornetzi]KYN22710.1 Peptidylprolyl isomerase-like 5 [Trachymyrmex cornetzi]
MKFHCYIEIHDRILSVCSQRRSQSILAFTKKSLEDDDVYLYLQTRQNKQGTKYQIVNNVKQVFTRFIADGKVTIRLTQPCHDLIIQSDNSIQLKSFLHILNQIINRHSQHDVLVNHTVMPNVFFNSSQFSMGKVKVVVKKKSEYPTLQGFPRTTEQLILSGLSRKSFDRQILRLQSLRILDLSDNNIFYLPKELGTLPHLQQLLLSQNNLGKSPKSKWTWLEQTAIKHNLHFLDISSNLLTELPTQIKNLNALIHLKVSQNALTYLPHNIRTLRNLRVLDVARNRLSYLPVTITYLRLQLLDVTENPFTESYNIKNDVCGNYSTMTVKMTSLVEWSAKSILKSRITYDASIIPYTLVDYLDEAKCCYLCRTACFDRYIKKLIYVPLPCAEIKKSMCTAIIFEAYFCSLLCANNILCKSK